MQPAALHIALVEDNPAHRQTYINMITHDNEANQIVSFEDGESFLDSLQKMDRYDCLLLDINLPDISGTEIYQQINRDYPHLPIIFITSLSSEEKALQSIADGVADYLLKGECNQQLVMRSIRYAIERKRSQQLSQDLQEARILNAQHQEFVSMVSHEFRTPLAIISSSQQLMRKKLPDSLPESFPKHLNKIRLACERLTKLIDNALCFSKLEEGQIQFYPRSFNLQVYMTTLLEQYQQIAPDYQFELGGDVLPANFHGDQEICEHIFSNVLSNAIKYSRGKCHHILLTSTVCEEDVSITIQDFGRGVDASEIERIGEKFYRSSNTVGTAGSGVGLYICRKLAEMHHGSLTFESVLDKGTRVTIRLPIKSP